LRHWGRFDSLVQHLIPVFNDWRQGEGVAALRVTNWYNVVRCFTDTHIAVLAHSNAGGEAALTEQRCTGLIPAAPTRAGRRAGSL
jgi:hypothetical protein